MESDAKVSQSALLIVGSTNVFNFSKPIIKIGRMKSNDLIIEDISVSRNHAELRFSDGKYEIIDLNSTGGTFVNGIKVDKRVLNKGDVITLASVHLVFGQGEFPESEETTICAHSINAINCFKLVFPAKLTQLTPLDATMLSASLISLGEPEITTLT